jgi:hypothetical protein
MTPSTLQSTHAAILDDCFDFSPPDGWLELVGELLTELETRWPDVRVLQLKSKFGGLRCYLGSAPREAHELAGEYERRAATICETCGQPGKQYGGGWIVTACEAHAPKGAK